jgi:hypothetical protein
MGIARASGHAPDALVWLFQLTGIRRYLSLSRDFLELWGLPFLHVSYLLIVVFIPATRRQ